MTTEHPNPITIEACRLCEPFEADPLAECKRRWPDFAYSDVEDVPKVGPVITARWTRDGRECGMSAPVYAGPDGRAEAEHSAAYHALVMDEGRKLRGWP